MLQFFSTCFSSITQENFFISSFSIWVPGRESHKIPTLLEIIFYVLKLKKDNMFCQITSTNF